MQATTGDDVFLYFKKTGAIRDLVIIGGANGRPVAPPGYTTIAVDVSMDVSNANDVGAVTFAYTCGGSRAPITNIRVVNDTVLGELLAGSAVAASAVQEPDVLSRALGGVVAPDVASAFGWEEVGRLDDSRCVVVQRGQGSPVVSLSVFRAPTPIPRYGQSSVVDLLPPALRHTSQSAGSLATAHQQLHRRWQVKKGDLNSLWFDAGSGAITQIVGYEVKGMVGVQDFDSDKDDDEGAPASGMKRSSLLKNGDVSGIVYRQPGTTSNVWTFSGVWSSSTETHQHPCHFDIRVPSTAATDPRINADFASATVWSIRAPRRSCVMWAIELHAVVPVALVPVPGRRVVGVRHEDDGAARVPGPLPTASDYEHFAGEERRQGA